MSQDQEDRILHFFPHARMPNQARLLDAIKDDAADDPVLQAALQNQEEKEARLLASPISDLSLQLMDHRLTTAHIYYFFPDYPNLLQMYLWQDYDQPPEFPILKKFLDFWEENLEGKLHSVRVTSRKLIHVSDYENCTQEWTLH